MRTAVAELLAMIAIALGHWGHSGPFYYQAELSEQWGRDTSAYTWYAPESCDMWYSSYWWGEFTAEQKQAAVDHEVGHCLVGLFHHEQFGILNNPFVCQFVSEADKTYYAPWRVYPWNLGPMPNRLVMGGIAFDGGR